MVPDRARAHEAVQNRIRTKSRDIQKENVKYRERERDRDREGGEGGRRQERWDGDRQSNWVGMFHTSPISRATHAQGKLARTLIYDNDVFLQVDRCSIRKYLLKVLRSFERFVVFLLNFSS